MWKKNSLKVWNNPEKPEKMCFNAWKEFRTQIKIWTLIKHPCYVNYDSEFKQYHNNKYCDIQSGFQ